MALSSSKMVRITNVLKDSSPLRDMTRYDMKGRQTCVTMKKCIMTSKVHHSERGSAISDCVVLVRIMSNVSSDRLQRMSFGHTDFKFY